ncbi:hypothetical protein [Fictibacillus barbaricus]|uniref:Uncharacterized protein n=1 Tax=Fictibacillus barbaricus TaxID=182136 RepID=A0ABS2ZES6_9BACL|nr:hypothetical protein [Fictibacillus barbaricus]MBN3546689.1 hypothetical protein [Fictibacillus barbaricus]GGB43024.1 hypothetical protein GCM10007199_05410 [Fictibacillus barbaricus]
MRAAIKAELNKINGLKLQYTGRSSDLFWLGFGEIFQIIRRGRTEETAEYTLHIQCSWRITLCNKIVVASRDIYAPNSEWDDLKNDFDWDIQGNNKFDERIKSFLKDTGRLMVERIEADDVGGIEVFLSNGYKLETFPDSSGDDDDSEHWRFFNRKENSPHFVVSGEGIERV